MTDAAALNVSFAKELKVGDGAVFSDAHREVAGVLLQVGQGALFFGCGLFAEGKGAAEHSAPCVMGQPLLEWLGLVVLDVLELCDSIEDDQAIGSQVIRVLAWMAPHVGEFLLAA